MSDLIASLSHAVIHTTAFLIAGIAFYEVMRRLGPAFGASAAVGSLVVVVGVTALAFSPWPRWRLPDFSAKSETSKVTSPLQAMKSDAPLARQGTNSGESLSPPMEKDTPVSLRDTAVAWFEVLREALGPPPIAKVEAAKWSWKTVVAGFIVACIGFGILRFALGLWGIRRLGSSGIRIRDTDLIDLVEILRAEMICRRPVELREVGELTTPATMGALHPVILLPADWRTWDELARRAVLAHELAHVCRNDYLTSLLAQFSLTLHFYHPLAHWLSSRLLFEQELAADAWSSGLTGGKSSYLMTLARLALERDRRAASWPVRAFLPSRGNFVRRIEMLRDSKSVRHVPASWRLQAIAFCLLAALGVLISGLRGPLVETTVFAQAPVVAEEAKKPQPAPTPSNSPFDLKYLPADVNVFAAIKPAELLKYPEVKELLDKPRETQPIKDYLIVKPEEIDQLIFFGTYANDVDPSKMSMRFFPGFILRMNQPQDWPLAIRRVIPRPEQAQHEGMEYTRFQGVPYEVCAFTPDKSTLILAQEGVIRTVIEDREEPSPRRAWDDVWPRVEKNQLVFAMDTRWLRTVFSANRLISPAREQLGLVSPLFEKVRAYAGGASLSPRLTIDINGTCGTEENAKSVADTIRAIVTLARNYEQSLGAKNPQVSKSQQEATAWLVKTIKSIDDHATVDQSGRTVSLRSSTDLGLAHWTTIAAKVIVSSQTGRMRIENINNLKQIGLAFHNYHDKQQHFPPPVLYGGKSGKVPYSWRVALLPYLNQEALYSQYNFDEPWDGPTNRKLLDKMPAVYSVPTIAGASTSTQYPSYFVLTGPRTALGDTNPRSEDGKPAQGQQGGAVQGDPPPFGFGGGRAIAGGSQGPDQMPGSRFPAIQMITDGTSNTILAVEATREIPWTKPEDLPFDYDLSKGPSAQPKSYGGYTPEGFNAVFCDGSVRFIRNSVNHFVLGALFTANGGEVISSDSY